jgi:outer membrane protein TolC
MLLLSEAGPSAAADGGIDSLSLSLDACVRSALAEGEEFRLAQADQMSAHALYLQARATIFPEVTLTGSYTRQFESVFRDGGDFTVESFEADTLAPLDVRVRDLERALPGAGLAGLAGLFSSTSFASENTYAAGVGVTQTLFSGGSTWHSIGAARHAMSSAQHQLDDREREVVLLVREAYLNALLANRTARIAQLALDQAESELSRVRLRQEAGEASEFDLLQAEVERDNQVPLLRQADAMRRVAYLELARRANLPSVMAMRLTTPLLDDAAIPAEPAAVDTVGLVTAALSASGVEAIAQEVEAREHAVGIAAAGKWPDVSLFGNYTRQAFPEDLFPKSGDWRTDANAGMRLSWSLFDGFRTKGEIQQSKAQAMGARQRLGQARELVREAVIQNRLELERSASELHARARTVEVGRRAYELASLRHEEGAASLIEVNQARIAYQIAQTNAAQARHAYFVALARLERYTGRPLFASIAGTIGGGGGSDR